MGSEFFGVGLCLRRLLELWKGSSTLSDLILSGATGLRSEKLFFHIITRAGRGSHLRTTNGVHGSMDGFHCRPHVIVLCHKVALEVSDTSLVSSIEIHRISCTGAD